ncbi:MAG: helix-turn-helix transcriptional regulator [Clostridia bacterium]|nr:helix-turn-helix transcriptional regulator [Clostridia bacterium]
MIIFKIKEMLEKDTEIKTRYALQKVTGWHYRRVDNYYKNRVVKIKKEEIDVMCKLFKCKVSDLIEFVDDKEYEEKYKELIENINSEKNKKKPKKSKLK